MCIILNKIDLPLAVSRPELEVVMHLHDLERGSRGLVTVMEISTVDSTNELQAELILNWMIAQKANIVSTPPPTQHAK